METYQIELLEPKAKKLLQELVKLKLIKVNAIISPKNEFKELLAKIQGKNIAPLTLEEITREVEIVREKCYAKK